MTWGITNTPEPETTIRHIEKFACFAKLELLAGFIEDIITVEDHFKEKGDWKGAFVALSNSIVASHQYELEKLPLYDVKVSSIGSEIRDYEKKQEGTRKPE